ncbi:farnesyl pyrophosphate synthase isoform X2 [Pteropus vampyrus]|uniref:Farnesyl pyrophosphate synthase n=1 Tax=Pteropus vampyrus TaxID=132908 RepID=A0A6P6CRY0_PTEVA|nr:farnesyl pyrophosphate synthase isoform X2 [Pteropus vampyrus]
MMPLSRWLRSVGVFLLPAPCWVPRERWLGTLRRPSLVYGGSVLGAWHSAGCWCQAWTEEPRAHYSSLRMNGDQKLDAFMQEKQNFLQCFPAIIKVLTDDLEHPEIEEALARLKQLQTFFLVLDDIMDSSVTRRGQLCWYRKPGIGLDAINDGLLIEMCIYRLLKHHCREQPYYLNLTELFLQSTYVTEIGQSLDLTTGPHDKVDLSGFTEKRYKTIVKHKTSFYTAYLPVAAGMYMAGIDGEREHATAKKILLEIGEFFQIQDDYLDAFGDPSVTGKIGTDIQDNKCSWLVVQCLQRASPEQRQVLQENYGQKEAEKVARVKALYEELDLPGVFSRYEEDSYRRITGLIGDLSPPLPPSIFLELAHNFYKRKK